MLAAQDFILATGTATTVRDFAKAAFRTRGMQLEFEGAGPDETSRDQATGQIRLRVNTKFYRPIDPARLVGNPAKARLDLDWKPILAGVAVAEAMAAAETGL